jgi:hypothetical protein
MSYTEKNEPKIQDIASIKEIINQAKGLVLLKYIVLLIAPITKIFGVNIDQSKVALMKADNLLKQAQELARLFDEFNDYFSGRGWIIYESLDTNIIKRAIETAKLGNIDVAEDILVDYFTPEIVRFWVNQLQSVKAFKPRWRLIQLALKDYEEARYHACIPVILAMMDGLVNELNNGRGFFSDTTELKAYNSLSANERGLVKLGSIFRTGRNKTRTEQITVPYRNGILHGTDLGYDNKIVAAKTWAALLALRDWAIKAEQKQLEEPPAKSIPSIWETFKQYQKTQETQQKIQEWKPRIFTSEQIFISEDVLHYEENTPERKLVEFLGLWKARNYGYMARLFEVKYQKFSKMIPQKIRDSFGQVELINFQIFQISDTSPAISEILVKLRYTLNQSEKEKENKFRLLYTDTEGDAKPRNEHGYNWYIIMNYFNPY